MTAQEIKELRQRSGWTQERFARELGVSVMTVSRWETGKQKPIPSLQHALDLLADYIRGDGTACTKERTGMD